MNFGVTISDESNAVPGSYTVVPKQTRSGGKVNLHGISKRGGTYPAALAEFSTDADQGNVAAQYKLGVMYANGEAYHRAIPRRSGAASL